jgi:serine/threonine protein kinase
MTCWLVMQLCSKNLFQHLTDVYRGVSEVESTEIVRWLQCIYNGLEALHENKMAHRDLKLENLCLFEDTLKIIDLQGELSQGSEMFGTEIYFPPEIQLLKSQQSLEGFQQYDMWCVGLMSLEMMSRVFFEERDRRGPSEYQMLPFPLVKSLYNRPARLVLVVRRSLNRFPKARLSAAEANSILFLTENIVDWEENAVHLLFKELLGDHKIFALISSSPKMPSSVLLPENSKLLADELFGRDSPESKDFCRKLFAQVDMSVNIDKHWYGSEAQIT